MYATLGRSFLQAGLDIEVGNIMDTGSDDNRTLLVRGEPVNRPFVHNFANQKTARLLREKGFVKVAFMRNSMSYIGELDVASGEITW